MKYLCLIYEDETIWSKMPKAESDRYMGDYGALTQDVKKNGQYLAGEALQPTASATTIRVRNGTTLTTDGPFAETKEQLGGFYLVDAKDLNDAIQIAARIPSARHGSIEVRPIMTFG
ncbi:MAG: YciI family protein [Gemmatimonadaceae bacterium]